MKNQVMSSLRSRILIADDHLLVAELCKKLLEPEFVVVDIVTDGAALVRKASESKPGVILVDIAMPVLDGLSAASQVKSLLRDVKIVFLTMNSDIHIAMDAFDKGASGFVLKTCAASELVLAVRTVLTGRRYMSPTLREPVEHLRWAGVKHLPEEDRLTARQREVLRLIAQGKRMKEVADCLEISFRTVLFHKDQIMAKIGARSRADLVKYALRNGILTA
jgi:DNA-binding NarL/FixJ family response regulator